MRLLPTLLLVPAILCGQAGIHYQQDFPPEEFRARWNRLFDKIGPDAVAVVQGVALTNGYSMPRQTNEFYYLCGVETPHSYLLLDGRTRKVTLYLPPRNPRLEASEGKSCRLRTPIWRAGLQVRTMSPPPTRFAATG